MQDIGNIKYSKRDQKIVQINVESTTKTQLIPLTLYKGSLNFLQEEAKFEKIGKHFRILLKLVYKETNEPKHEFISYDYRATFCDRFFV